MSVSYKKVFYGQFNFISEKINLEEKNQSSEKLVKQLREKKINLEEKEQSWDVRTRQPEEKKELEGLKMKKEANLRQVVHEKEYKNREIQEESKRRVCLPGNDQRNWGGG